MLKINKKLKFTYYNHYFRFMKFLAIALLVFFIIFLSAPIVVMMIEKNADVSLIIDFSEEDSQNENKEIKELKSDFTLKCNFEFVGVTLSFLKKNPFENCSKHDTISEEIFIPPPELI